MNLKIMKKRKRKEQQKEKERIRHTLTLGGIQNWNDI